MRSFIAAILCGGCLFGDVSRSLTLAGDNPNGESAIVFGRIIDDQGKFLAGVRVRVTPPETDRETQGNREPIAESKDRALERAHRVGHIAR